MPKTSTQPDRRGVLIRLIHIAKRDLRMDEDTYRTMLRTASGGISSTADMTERQLQAVVDQAKRSGFVVRVGPGKAAAAKGRGTRRLDMSHEARKVRALWLFLHHLGAVRDPSEAALAAYCRRIAKVDDLHWAASGQMVTLIETLKKWAMRGFLQTAISKQQTELAGRPGVCLDQRVANALAAAQYCLLRGQGYDAHWSAWCYLNRALGLPDWVDLPAPALNQPEIAAP